jgi:tetratricopeptide (TPR) repeat protein
VDQAFFANYRSPLQIHGGNTLTRFWQPARIVVLSGILLAAIFVELRITFAAIFLKQHNTSSTLRAARLTPGDEEIYLQLADLDQASRAAYLRSAIARNSQDATPWINLGLLAEMNGNPKEAEADFRQAAQLDVRSGPSWMMTNLYFQQGNEEGFRYWGNRYRAFAAGDTSGLFRMEWKRNHNISHLLQAFGTLNCKELTNLASYLDTQAPAAEVVAVDQQLLSCPDEDGAKAVMTDISRLLLADQAPQALELWNKLNRNGRFHYAQLDPSADQVLTNADFSTQLDDPGFDWRVNQTAGVRVHRMMGTPELEFDFDGNEPAVSTLLFQPVVMVQGATYHLSCTVNGEEANTSGFGWRLVELSTGATLASGLGDASTRHDGSISWEFQAPASSKTMVIAFTYARPTGEARAQGKVILSDVRLSREDKS